MVINEIFYSLQGEGFLAGAPSVFVRIAGCPLKCKWCDTAYAFSYDAGENLTAKQIAGRIKQFKCKNIVITGGEPLVNSDMTERTGLRDLASALNRQGGHVTIETAGIVFVPDLNCDLISISPKLTNAQIKEQIDIAPLQNFIDAYDYQLKFVVEKKNDVIEVGQLLNNLKNINRDKVMLMPQAETRDKYIERAPEVADWCLKYGFAFSPRLQILIWDNQRAR